MKKQWKGFASGVGVTLLCVGLVGSAFAAYQKQATLDYTGINITLNGSAVTPADANGNAVEPFAIDGTTYLPVRGIASAMGLNVSWDQATQTVALTSAGQTPSAPSGTYSRTNPAPVGTAQSISVNGILEKYNASVVIEESIRGADAWAKIKAANQFNQAAPDGKEYVLVKIKASVNSVTDDKAISLSDYSFTPYSSDNVEYDSTYAVTPTPEFSGSVYAGGTLEGYAVYAVSKTDSNPKLVFGANYDGTGGIWFSMTE